MCVRPTAQLFSHSVAADEMSSVKLGSIDCDAKDTAEFIDRVDKLLVSLNRIFCSAS